MDTKETASRTSDAGTVLEDIEYYKYIFKKTEKMVCAVFHILRYSHDISQNDSVVKDLETASRTLMDVALESLRGTPRTISIYANSLKYALIAFESKLRMAQSAHVLDTDLLEVFVHELDSVQRSLKKYIESAVPNPLRVGDVHSDSVRLRRPVRTKTNLLGSVTGEDVQIRVAGPSRRELVLNVLRDKGEATIKDITSVITDCSEKTIQRELISLRKDNVIVREGERRWSKYRLV